MFSTCVEGEGGAGGVLECTQLIVSLRNPRKEDHKVLDSCKQFVLF